MIVIFEEFVDPFVFFFLFKPSTSIPAFEPFPSLFLEVVRYVQIIGSTEPVSWFFSPFYCLILLIRIEPFIWSHPPSCQGLIVRETFGNEFEVTSPVHTLP